MIIGSCVWSISIFIVSTISVNRAVYTAKNSWGGQSYLQNSYRYLSSRTVTFIVEVLWHVVSVEWCRTSMSNLSDSIHFSVQSTQNASPRPAATQEGSLSPLVLVCLSQTTLATLTNVHQDLRLNRCQIIKVPVRRWQQTCPVLLRRGIFRPTVCRLFPWARNERQIHHQRETVNLPCLKTKSKFWFPQSALP